MMIVQAKLMQSVVPLDVSVVVGGAMLLMVVLLQLAVLQLAVV